MFNNLFYSPTLFIKSSRDSAMGDSESTRPLSQPPSFSVVAQESRFACILSLLHGSRPFAISRFIVAVVVDAFNAMLWGRLLAHVLQELRKRIAPLFAHNYSATSVPVITGIVRVVAPRLHFAPRTVFRRFISTTSTGAVASARLDGLLFKIATSHDSGVTALTEALPARITRVGVASELDHRELAVFAANFVSAVFAAPARLNITGAKRTSTDDLFRTALAFAVPVSACLTSKPVPCVVNYCQFAELFSSNVFCFTNSVCRITRRHDSTPPESWIVIEPNRSTTTASARFILA